MYIYEPKGRAREYALLAINQYVSCSHGCFYCYARKMWQTDPVRKIDWGELEREAENLCGTDRRVLLSFLSDPYQPMESDLGITRRILEILSANMVPFQVLTKGGAIARRDFDLYGQKDMFAVTLTTVDPVRASEWEPGAASPELRIGNLEAAQDRGIATWVSLEPVVDAGESLRALRAALPFVDHVRIGKMNHLKNPTDWRLFGEQAVEMVECAGKSYYVKDDLAAFMTASNLRNADMRIVGPPVGVDG